MRQRGSSRYWIGRILQAIPMIFGASLIVFVMLHLAPGDPVSLLFEDIRIGEAAIEKERQALGLDDPLPIQYVKMMAGMFTGELTAYTSRRPVIKVVADTLPTTFAVVLTGFLIGVVISIPLGIAAGQRPGSLLDRMLGTGVSMMIALPGFVVALLLLRIFAEWLQWVPASGIRPAEYTGWNPVKVFPHVILPSAVLFLSLAPTLARYTRDAVNDVLAEDYVRTAYAKGLAKTPIMWRHVLRNALIPVTSVVGILLPIALSGTAVIEYVFDLPGLGRLAVQGAQGRDYPIVMTTVMLAGILVVVSNLIVDILYGLIDPRIRLG